MFIKKKTAILIATYGLAALIALGAWALIAANRAERAALELHIGRQRAFGELVTGLSELSGALEKSLYATDPAMAESLCTQVFGKAMAAQLSLGALPLAPAELERTAGFISRTGDYAYALSRGVIRTGGYTPEERENLVALWETAAILAENMRQLRQDMAGGQFSMAGLEQAEASLEMGAEALPGDLSGAMRLMEQEFPEIPSLIYDGPFSEHLSRREALFLKDKPAFAAKEALMEARALLESGKISLREAGQTQGDIPTWDFSGKWGDGDCFLSMSQQGGRPVSLLCSRSPGPVKLSDEEAVAAAGAYLDRHGFPNMESSYFLKQEGIMTVNFAPMQGDVLLYPDLVKVSVALDDGSVVGLETRGYLMNHRNRWLPGPQVSRQEAEGQVAEGLRILGSRLCVIPRAGGEELLCHEFTCEGENERHYVIYVDALSGRQEKILILLEDETGTLTL